MGQLYAGTNGVNTEAEDQVFKASKVTERADVATVTDAGAATYTAAQVLGGIILRDPTGDNRTDVLPTAALLVAAMKNPAVGDIVKCKVINNADANEVITISAGANGDIAQIAATRVIPQNTSRDLFIRITGIGSSAAYIVYM